MIIEPKTCDNECSIVCTDSCLQETVNISTTIVPPGGGGGGGGGGGEGGGEGGGGEGEGELRRKENS